MEVGFICKALLFWCVKWFELAEAFKVSWTSSWREANDIELKFMQQHGKCTHSGFARHVYAFCEKDTMHDTAIKDLPITVPLFPLTGRSEKTLRFKVTPRTDNGNHWPVPQLHRVKLVFKEVDSPAAWAAQKHGCDLVENLTVHNNTNPVWTASLAPEMQFASWRRSAPWSKHAKWLTRMGWVQDPKIWIIQLQARLSIHLLSWRGMHSASYDLLAEMGRAATFPTIGTTNLESFTSMVMGPKLISIPCLRPLRSLVRMVWLFCKRWRSRRLERGYNFTKTYQKQRGKSPTQQHS